MDETPPENVRKPVAGYHAANDRKRLDATDWETVASVVTAGRIRIPACHTEVRTVTGRRGGTGPSIARLADGVATAVTDAAKAGSRMYKRRLECEPAGKRSGGQV